MNKFIGRSKIVLLCLLLMASASIDAFTPRTTTIIDGTYLGVCIVFGLCLKNVIRKKLLKQTERYSDTELACVRRIVEPYVTSKELDDILLCIRKPIADSKFFYEKGCCFLSNVIVIDPKLFNNEENKTFEPCNLTDVERAYFILHEYGHKINRHKTITGDVIRVLKLLPIYVVSLVALESYIIPHMKYRTLWSLLLSEINALIGIVIFDRNDEYKADAYAFNKLKKDAPVGCLALEKSCELQVAYRPSFREIVLINMLDREQFNNMGALSACMYCGWVMPTSAGGLAGASPVAA